jgi:hypothetical protein
MLKVLKDHLFAIIIDCFYGIYDAKHHIYGVIFKVFEDIVKLLDLFETLF